MRENTERKIILFLKKRFKFQEDFNIRKRKNIWPFLWLR